MIALKTLAGIVSLSIFLVACKPSNNQTTITDLTEKSEVDKVSSTPSPNGISKATFDNYVAMWNAGFRTYMANDSLHYFDMDPDDLSAITAQSNLDKARFYMGMDSTGLPHIMLVGIVSGAPNFNIIEDYTTVCPPVCRD